MSALNVIAALAGLFFSSVTALLFSLLGGGHTNVTLVVFLVVAHLGALAFAVDTEGGKYAALGTLALVSPVFVVLVGMSLYEQAAALFDAYAPDRQFSVACANTGVHILHAPTSPVGSIGVDWTPEKNDGPRSKYLLGFGGLIEGIVSFPPYPEMLVDAAQADVVVTHTVSDREQERQGPRFQKLIRYTLTATDRRDGVKLATMAFAVDFSKNHACGANVEHAIDLAAFMKAATLFHGQSGAPNAAAPVQEVVPEVLATQEYAPVRVLSAAEAAAIDGDRGREQSCEAAIPKMSRNSWQRRFSADPTGLRRMLPAREIGMLWCDADGILSGGFLDDKGRRYVELDRYSIDGRLLYKLKFKLPQGPDGVSVLVPSTLRSENGYLQFHLLDGSRNGDTWSLRRLTKLRIREPAAAASQADLQVAPARLLQSAALSR